MNQLKNIIPTRRKAIFYAKRSIAQIVTDVVNLEDINYTVPEVQTLLDGITVGGHKIQDELITLNQINAWRYLFSSLENNTFSVSKEYLFKLHTFVANQEALTWGEFRTGSVTISGTSYIPPEAKVLPKIWDEILDQLDKYRDIYDKSIYLFAEMARTQFFFDGNKRTARMMMSGVLLDNGYPMINVSAKDKTRFNSLMIDYYESHDITELNKFLKTCLDKTVVKEFMPDYELER